MNDTCFNINPAERVSDLFERAVEPLLKDGVRHLVLFEVPPRLRKFGPIVDPSPGFVRHHAKIDAWNQALKQKIGEWKHKYPDVDIRLFPTHGLFTDIFESPGGNGFNEEDVGRAYGGKIWMDGLHPTSAVHSLIADRLLQLYIS